tara:strand:- start:824 stop:1330 length:507 start_codon:yes stop_codon:yes gene_type:complete
MFKKVVIILLIPIFLILANCSKNVKDAGLTAEEKRRKNIDEGRGVSLKGIVGSRGSTNYQFSSSNPMWRASLETLDFLPLITVDYSGGVIITDWYSDGSATDSIKITVRFLSNEIRSDSLKIIIHKKICRTNSSCTTNISQSNLIKDELRSTILRKAALLVKSDKNKK